MRVLLPMMMLAASIALSSMPSEARLMQTQGMHPYTLWYIIITHWMVFLRARFAAIIAVASKLKTLSVCLWLMQSWPQTLEGSSSNSTLEVFSTTAIMILTLTPLHFLPWVALMPTLGPTLMTHPLLNRTLSPAALLLALLPACKSLNLDPPSRLCFLLPLD